MKPNRIIQIFVTLGILAFIVTSCDKNRNEEPDVTFSVGSELYQVDDNTFYSVVDGELNQITASGMDVVSVNLATYNDIDSIFAAVGGKITGLVDQYIYFGVQGYAEGLVVWTGDSLRGTSHIYADYPIAEGHLITLDEDYFGEYRYAYEEPGTYTAQLVARNWRDIEHDDKEKVYSIQVVVLDPADYPYLVVK